MSRSPLPTIPSQTLLTTPPLARYYEPSVPSSGTENQKLEACVRVHLGCNLGAHIGPKFLGSRVFTPESLTSTLEHAQAVRMDV